MWLIAIIGRGSAFIESTLTQIYKRKAANGDSYGGPVYYIETALQNRGLAVTLWIIGAVLALLVGRCYGRRQANCESHRYSGTAHGHPIKQGLVQMLSVLIDTLLTCSATVLMCLCSGDAPTADIAGATYVQSAASSALGYFEPILLTFSMVLFAFSTLPGNFFHVNNCLTLFQETFNINQAP